MHIYYMLLFTTKNIDLAYSIVGKSYINILLKKKKKSSGITILDVNIWLCVGGLFST